jgi:hypothetical protein
MTTEEGSGSVRRGWREPRGDRHQLPHPFTPSVTLPTTTAFPTITALPIIQLNANHQHPNLHLSPPSPSSHCTPHLQPHFSNTIATDRLPLAGVRLSGPTDRRRTPWRG